MGGLRNLLSIKKFKLCSLLTADKLSPFGNTWKIVMLSMHGFCSVWSVLEPPLFKVCTQEEPHICILTRTPACDKSQTCSLEIIV